MLVLGALLGAHLLQPAVAAVLTKPKVKRIATKTATKVFNSKIGPATAGLQDAVQWAFVKADGTIPAQSGGIEVASDSSGTTFVRFPGAVNDTAIAVQGVWDTDDSVTQTAATACGGGPAGATCEGPLNDPRVVYVETYDPTGTSVNGDFFIVAIP